MVAPDVNLHLIVLQNCAATAPKPWYPSIYVRESSVPREQLDPYLDRLRMAGLIHLTDWTQDSGQGYLLTPEGEQALHHPSELRGLLAEGELLPTTQTPLWTEEEPQSTSRGDRVRRALQYPARPIVSYLLIGVNVMVFVAGLQVASRRGISSQDFLWLKNPPLPAVQEIQHEMGALTGGDLVKGEWYRLLTCCFVHFGLIHLGVNMWSLYMIGPFLEGLWGRGRFLFLYIAAGLAGSCAMALASPPTAEGAGASGAIWGIFTSLIPWILLNRRYLAPHWASTMLRRLAFLIVLNVGISMMPGISAAAHFGGGAMGVIAAVALNENRFGRSSRRWLAGLAALALPCVCVAGLVGRIQYADRDTIDFNERLSRAREAVEGAEEIAKQEFDPLLRQPLKVRATEEVESATAAIRQLLDKLDVSFDVLKNAGPYRDPQIETERWSFLEKIQAQRDYYTGLYLQTFLIPAAQDAARTGVGAYLEVADGLETLGPRVLQQPARVTACEHMEMARAKMLALVQFDEKLGSVENPRLEKIRSALGQRLEAQAALLNFTESFLKRNDDWSDTNKRQYARLKHEFKSAEDRWKTALAK